MIIAAAIPTPEKSHALYDAIVCIAWGFAILIVAMIVRCLAQAWSIEEKTRAEKAENEKRKSETHHKKTGGAK